MCTTDRYEYYGSPYPPICIATESDRMPCVRKPTEAEQYLDLEPVWFRDQAKIMGYLLQPAADQAQLR